jgi:hypothetical protein
MKKLLLLLLCIGSPSWAAQTCAVTATWVDSTPAGPGYAPTYKAWVRKNGGASTLGTAAAPSVAFPAFACAGSDLIEVQAQNRNTLGGGIDGPLSAWVAASVPVSPSSIDTINILINVAP